MAFLPEPGRGAATLKHLGNTVCGQVLLVRRHCADLKQVAERTANTGPDIGTGTLINLGSLLFAADNLVPCLLQSPSPAAATQVGDQFGIPCQLPELATLPLTSALPVTAQVPFRPFIYPDRSCGRVYLGRRFPLRSNAPTFVSGG
jgi:hypothetical protein